MNEPGFDNCSTCRRLILRRDSLKHSMELLEESIQRKQRNLEMFIRRKYTKKTKKFRNVSKFKLVN